MAKEFLRHYPEKERHAKLAAGYLVVDQEDWIIARREHASIDLFRRECEQAEEAYSQIEHRAGLVPDLLAACEAALELPEICEEIGCDGEHDCVRDGHGMIKTTDGEYVKMHDQGGYPARDRILALIRAAISKVRD